MTKHEVFPAVQPKIVRLAGSADAHKIRKLLDRLHDEVPNPGDLPPDDQKVWAVINQACAMQGALCGVIDGPDDDIVASIGLFWNEPWWTRHGLISQYWKFVDKDYRYGGRYHKALVDFATWHRRDLSEKLGYKLCLEDSFITKGDVRPRARLWGKHGTCVGMIFLSKD